MEQVLELLRQQTKENELIWKELNQYIEEQFDKQTQQIIYERYLRLCLGEFGIKEKVEDFKRK